MTTKELNDRITLMQEDTFLVDMWVGASACVMTLVIVLVLWEWM